MVAIVIISKTYPKPPRFQRMVPNDTLQQTLVRSFVEERGGDLYRVEVRKDEATGLVTRVSRPMPTRCGGPDLKRGPNALAHLTPPLDRQIAKP